MSSLSALVKSQRPTLSAQSQTPSAEKPRKLAHFARHLAIGAGISAVLVLAQAANTARQESGSVSHHGSAGVKRTQLGAEVRWRQAQTKVYLDDSLDSGGV